MPTCIHVYTYVHMCMYISQTPVDPEVPLQTHILHASGGPLCEAHIVILKDLLSKFPGVSGMHACIYARVEVCDLLR